MSSDAGTLEVISGDPDLGDVGTVTYEEIGDRAIIDLGGAKLEASDPTTADHVTTAFNELSGSSLNPSSWASPAPTPAQFQVYGPFTKMRRADGSNFWQDPNTGEEFDPADYPDVDSLTDRQVVEAIDDRTGPTIEYSGETSAAETYGEALTELGDDVRVSGDGVLDRLRKLGSGALDAENVFTTNAPGNTEAEYNLTVYESGDYTDRVGSVTFEDDADVTPFLNAVAGAPGDVAGYIEGSAAIEEAAARRDARRETRETARDAAEAAGVDLEEFEVAAAYGEDLEPGTVTVRDRDTGETRRIAADAPGGVGSAIDAATGDGQFVADGADPAASGSGSGDGLGARAAGAVVLLFGAIAAALGWLS